MTNESKSSLKFIVGRNIAKLRNRAGLTQADVAESLGKSLGTIKNYEGGHTPPPFEVIEMLADLFEVAPASFFPGKPLPERLTKKHPIASDIEKRIEKLPENHLQILDVISNLMEADTKKARKRKNNSSK